MIKKMLIMSDSHGDTYLVDDILKKHPNMDLYIHAGDSQKGEAWLKKRFDYYVLGNSDWLDSFTTKEVFIFANRKIVLVHGHLHAVPHFPFLGDPIPALTMLLKKEFATIAIYGHTHKRMFVKKNGLVFINPGALESYERYECRSYAILLFSKNAVECEFIKP